MWIELHYPPALKVKELRGNEMLIREFVLENTVRNRDKKKGYRLLLTKALNCITYPNIFDNILDTRRGGELRVNDFGFSGFLDFKLAAKQSVTNRKKN